MFNSTYGAGKRAGMCPQPTLHRRDGTKVLITPACPFPAWRLLSCALWHSGCIDGMMERLSKKEHRWKMQLAFIAVQQKFNFERFNGGK